MDELKKCPFCGGEAFLQSSVKISQQSRYSVRCRDCLVETASCTDALHIITTWNTRHEAPNAMLREALEWYANKGNYYSCFVEDELRESDISTDGGDRARKALASLPQVGCDDEGCPHYGTPHGHSPASDKGGADDEPRT